MHNVFVKLYKNPTSRLGEEIIKRETKNPPANIPYRFGTTIFSNVFNVNHINQIHLVYKT